MRQNLHNLLDRTFTEKGSMSLTTRTYNQAGAMSLTETTYGQGIDVDKWDYLMRNVEAMPM